MLANGEFSSGRRRHFDRRYKPVERSYFDLVEALSASDQVAGQVTHSSTLLERSIEIVMVHNGWLPPT